MYRNFKFCFCVFVLLYSVKFSQCDFPIPKPIIGIEMSNAGFHRELFYTVQFDYPLAGKDCEYVVQQSLPAAVYISVDQLNDLKRLNKLIAIYPAFVDIEKPADKSDPFRVLLKGVPKITDSFKLPIHFRYHAPREESSTVRVDIEKPIMFIKCLESNHNFLDNKELNSTPDVRYCLDIEQLQFTEFTGAGNAEDCDWKLINSILQMRSSLSAEIPVGNKQAFAPILYATIVLSWAISLWTVFRTHSVPRSLNQKLEEQRILQNKNQ